MGLGVTELVIILVIVILVFGPSRLEGVGSSLGKAIKGFKKGVDVGEDDKTKKEIDAQKSTEKEKS